MSQTKANAGAACATATTGHGGGSSPRCSLTSALFSTLLAVTLACGLLPAGASAAFADPAGGQPGATTGDVVPQPSEGPAPEKQPEGSSGELAPPSTEGGTSNEEGGAGAGGGELGGEEAGSDESDGNGVRGDESDGASAVADAANAASLALPQAPEQPDATGAQSVATWADLKTQLDDASSTVEVFDLASISADDRPDVLEVARSVTFTNSSDASAVVTTPMIDLAEGVTLSLVNITIQGRDVARENMAEATVRGQSIAGSSNIVCEGALVVGSSATVLAPGSKTGDITRNCAAVSGLARVDVLAGGTVQGTVVPRESMPSTNSFVITTCEEVNVLGGSVIQADILDNTTNNGWSNWSPIMECRNVTVDGGTVKAGDDPRAYHFSAPALKWCSRVTLNDATVLGGAGDYTEGLITIGANDSLFAGDPVELRLDVRNTVLQAPDAKYAELRQADDLYRNVGMPDSDAIANWPTTVRVDCSGLPATVNLGEGAVVAGPSVTVKGVAGAAIIGSDRAEADGVVTVNVAAGAEVRGGDVRHGNQEESYRDVSAGTYTPLGGAAVTGACVVQTGGSVSGGTGPQGGVGVRHGYNSTISGGTLTGGTGTSGYGGAAMTESTSLAASEASQVTGGESLNGQGGTAVNDLDSLSVSDDVRVTGGKSTTWGGNGVYSVSNVSMSGGTVSGGVSSEPGKRSGPGIYWCGDVRVTGGSVSGGAGAIDGADGGAGIESLWGSTFVLTDCEVRGGDGSVGASAISGDADYQMGLTAERAVLAAGEGLNATKWVSWGSNAIQNLGGTLSFTDCEVRGGKDSHGGTAVYAYGVSAEVVVSGGSIVGGEGANGRGGPGIKDVSGGVTLFNGADVRSGDTAAASANEGEVAVGNVGGSLTASDSSIVGGASAGAKKGGDGISNVGDTVKLTNCTVSGGNSAQGNGGAGVKSVTGDVTISAGSVIRSGDTSASSTAEGDDAVGGVGGSLTVSDSTIAGGASAGVGKASYGISNVGGAVNLTNCTVRGGDSAQGNGGIALYWVNRNTGGTKAVGCTVAGGSGNTAGGGDAAKGGDGFQFACYGRGGDLVIEDCIVTGGDGAAEAGTAVRNCNTNVRVTGHPDSGAPCTLTGGTGSAGKGGYAVLATGGNVEAVDAELTGSDGTTSGGCAIDTVSGSVKVSGSRLVSGASGSLAGRFGVGSVQGGVELRDSTVHAGASREKAGGAAVDWVNRTSGSTLVSGCELVGGDSEADRGGFAAYLVGGPDNAGASLTVENSTLTAGSGRAEGGAGIATVAGDVTVTNSQVFAGDARDGAAGRGGHGVDTSKYGTASGFVPSTGNLTVQDSRIEGGDCAAESGCGIYCQTGDIVLTKTGAEGASCVVTSGSGPSGCGIRNADTGTGDVTVSGATVQSAQDSAVYALQATVSVSGDDALVEGYRDHTSALFPAVWCKNLTLSSGKLLSHGGVNTLNLWGSLLMTGGVIAHDTSDKYAVVALGNASTSLGYDGSFAAIGGGSIDVVDGGIGIAANKKGDSVQTYYLQEGADTQWRLPAMDEGTRQSFAVTALASDGSALDAGAVGGAARIAKDNPLGDAALCLGGEQVVVTFDRALREGDVLVCQARDWDAEGEVWTSVDCGEVALADDASGKAVATFTTPARDVRVWLGKGVTGVSLDKNSLALDRGSSQQLTATVSPDDAADKSVSWSSSDPSVVSVDEDGTVHALSAGSATVTATTSDGGFTDTCDVEVTVPESQLLSVSASSGGIVDPEGLVDPVAGLRVSVVAEYGYGISQVLLDGADVTADLELDLAGRSGVYELRDDSPRTLHVAFAKLDQDGMAKEVGRLDGIEGPLSEEDASSVLDIKRDFEAMAEDVRAKVPDAAADRLHELLGMVPGIEVAVEADADAPALALGDAGRARLLYAIDGQDVADFQAGRIDLLRVKLTAYERAEEEIGTEAASALADVRDAWEHGRYVDVRVEQSTYKGGNLVDSTAVTVLPRPVELAFSLDGLPEDMKGMALSRAHEEGGAVTATLLDAAVRNGALLAESDRFSVFDLLYTQSATPPAEPDGSAPAEPGDPVRLSTDNLAAATGDPLESGLVLLLGAVLVASAVAVAFTLRKKRR